MHHGKNQRERQKTLTQQYEMESRVLDLITIHQDIPFYCVQYHVKVKFCKLTNCPDYHRCNKPNGRDITS